jgi:hypothetical protein
MTLLLAVREKYCHEKYVWTPVCLTTSLHHVLVVLDGSAETLRQHEDVKEFYLGLGTAGRRSYRDVKHYRRRKRWLA